MDLNQLALFARVAAAGSFSDAARALAIDRAQVSRGIAALERDLDGRDFVSDREISIADVALFPHLTATKAFNLGHDAERYPRVHAWMKRLKAIPAMGKTCGGCHDIFKFKE